MDITDGITDRQLRIGAVFFDGFNDAFKFRACHSRHQKSENIDAVFDGFADKTIHDIIRIGATVVLAIE